MLGFKSGGEVQMRRRTIAAIVPIIVTSIVGAIIISKLQDAGQNPRP